MVATDKHALPVIAPEEYLAQEMLAQEKHEYYAGEVISMAGASINHNYKEKEYIPFTTTYPDVLVVASVPQCYNERSDTLTNTNLIMIVEVLSESTSQYDRFNFSCIVGHYI